MRGDAFAIGRNLNRIGSMADEAGTEGCTLVPRGHIPDANRPAGLAGHERTAVFRQCWIISWSRQTVLPKLLIGLEIPARYFGRLSANGDQSRRPARWRT